MVDTRQLERPLHMMMIDGGRKTGPATSFDVIAKAIMLDPKDIPTVDFFPIAGNVVDITDEAHKDLSTDQGYLLIARLTVQVENDSSQYTPFLECSQPSNVNYTRWLMKASQVLCFYVTDSCIKTIAETS